jgi:hypothetical protein
MRIMSSSNKPTHMRKMLRAGMRFERGIGKGRDRKAAEITIANPQKKWEKREFVMGCLKAESFDVKDENFKAAK